MSIRHVNLATVTYLFEGEIIHRDSFGTMMPIRPGAVNWMTAGRGIVHSERTSPELKARGSRLCGSQTWVALPAAYRVRERLYRRTEAPGLADHYITGKQTSRCSTRKVNASVLRRCKA
jgi:redox-sensitive bicupin YhaK (pirin superfamily)